MAEHRGRLRHTFQVFKGFSAKLPAAAAEALRRNPNVSVVEPIRVLTTAATQYMPIGSGQAWGLDRIDQRYRPLSGTMTYSHDGSGVYAYIIDSGIRTSHGEFGGRARNVFSVFGDNGDDCHGHGTHVAGIVGGATYGVAKRVQLRGIKVIDCQQRSTNEWVAMAIDWVSRYRVNPAVANISLQTCNKAGVCTPDAALDIATTNLAKSGVFVAVSAGNYSKDACLSSPGRAPGTFTVAASTSGDARRLDSNWGRCVDAYAPGDLIRSAGLASYSTVMGGTSMAAPHVAGVAALYKQAYGNAASATIVSDLKSWSTANIISSGTYGSTPNRLLYKGGL
jgi:subtilisin family serine protease